MVNSTDLHGATSAGSVSDTVRPGVWKDRMLESRYEIKYHLTHEQALRIREFVQSHITLDEFSVGKPNFSYAVHSLYLDSDDFKTYWDTVNGNKNRFKLRLRYYDPDPKSPVFFEIKRRMDRTIHKERGGVRNEMVPLLLSGHLPEEGHLVSRSPKQLVALQRFSEFMQRLKAQPKVHVAYEREAYVSENDSHRVTIDRHIRAEPNFEGCITTEMAAPVAVYGGTAILELKFTNRFPDWFRRLTETFNLMQCSAAKYVEGVNQIGHEALGAPFAGEGEAPARLRAAHEARFKTRPRRFPDWIHDLDT